MNLSLSQIFKFPGGVHPPEHKLESTGTPIQKVPVPKMLVLPLRQHVGHIPKVLVKSGDHVLKGQLLAEANGYISAAVHAPTSGTLVAIDEQVIPHPSGLPDLCITMESDGKDEWLKHEPLDYRNMQRSELIQRITESGIVGLGGATFPTHVKLRADARNPVTTLILNGAECEPYITCDDLLMRERADEIIQGAVIMQTLLGSSECLIGIEDNKPEAVAAMNEAITRADFPAKVVVVPTLYPSGDSRRLIALLTGKESPAKGRTTEIGVQCFNVATAQSLYRFMAHGETVVSRVVTLTGNVARPGNYEALLGTSVKDLLEAAGGIRSNTDDYVMGGPMMGFSLPSVEVPMTKAMNCVIASTPNLFPPPPMEMPCIRCVACAEACPVNLQPQELYWYSKSNNLEKAQEYQLFDCIECGCCSYVCPSHIPLVQYYRYAKSETIAQDRAKRSADLARIRNDERLARIEREKLQRAQKHAQRTAKAETAGDDSDKKAAIEAAMARAKEQKETVVPQNTENLSPTVAAEIASVDAVRAGAVSIKTE
jgi:Na+-translocating ferredoxin:NAD+ oxidoreductase subunit C